MVLQMAVSAGELPKFYGMVMEENLNKKTDNAKVWRSKEIFGAEKMVLIEHENAVYRLMITRQGKLILNK